MSKEKDLNFIKEFSKITIASVCKKLNVNKSNLWAGKASVENTKAVKTQIEKEIENLKNNERF